MFLIIMENWKCGASNTHETNKKFVKTLIENSKAVVRE